MSFSNAAETKVLEQIFLQQATGYGSTMYLSLHTADPGEAGDQTTSEVSYTDYTRVAVTMDGTDFSVSGNTASNDNEELFPECNGGTATATFLALGTASTGTGELVAIFAISPSISISSGTVPAFAAGSIGFVLN